MLRASRRFFEERGILEVDVPILSELASIDAHIDLVPALYGGAKPCTLHSSPEYGMKRLLAEGVGDIYQLSHVFRDGELGTRHNPEFMMAEWYRVGLPFAKMIEETVEFIRLFLGPLPLVQLTYQETFQKILGFDPLGESFETIYQKYPIELYHGIDEEGKDGLLTLLLSKYIEPQLGQKSLFVLTHYPASQAALAQTLPNGTAERFEVYHEGVELANGYHELADPFEQERRLHEANVARQKLGKAPLPLDTLFLEALKKGIPPCCGVAVGFDRLMMLRHKAPNLAAVIPFAFGY